MNDRAVQSPASQTAALSAFLASIRYEQIPAPVVARCEDLFLDWFACTLAGRSARPIRILEAFAATMGPVPAGPDGAAQILTNRTRSSPLFAALVNGGASHVVEQDDLHNSSVLHPATVVFPAALATAQATGASGRDFIAACVAGYECGIRVGEFLGRSHYRVFHTTGTAGTVAAAATKTTPTRLAGSTRTRSAPPRDFSGEIPVVPPGVMEIEPLPVASPAPIAERESTPPRESRATKATTSSVVSLNSATRAELETLPGIGPKTAEAIMAYRSERGAFSSIEELINVKGIGPKKMEKMRPFLRL